MKFRGCMQRQAEMGASVEHKNVVRAYTLEHKGQHLYLVIEHTDGPSLAELLEEAL